MKNQDGMSYTTAITAAFIVLVIVALSMFLINRQEDAETNTNTQSNQQATNQESSNANETSSPAPGNEAAPTEEAKLVAVGEYSGNGVATRTTDGKFIHTITAQLDDPADGDFYEGWLTGPSVVSTGMLEKEGEGEWSLVFTTDEDLSNHNSVVITEETGANGLDGVPEDHVLEGRF